MDEAKRAYREAEETSKEAWRNRDGEDLADKVGNLGDDIRKEAGNAGDDIRRTLGDARNELRDRPAEPTGEPAFDDTMTPRSR